MCILVWIATGPLFQFSDTWQLVINTGTTIVTFLMVFLLQRSQNKESQAVQIKLNELLAAVEGASNRLLNLEDRSEEDLKELHARYSKLAEMASRPTEAHSIEEAEDENFPIERSRVNGTASTGFGTSLPEGGRGASGDDLELAQFLQATEKLRERTRWHEEQAASHLEAAAAMAEALGLPGPRTSGSAQQPVEVAKPNGTASAHGKRRGSEHQPRTKRSERMPSRETGVNHGPQAPVNLPERSPGRVRNGA